MNITHQWRRLALSLLAGMACSTAALAATTAALTVSSPHYTLGQSAPTVALTASSTEGGRFDVHVGLIGPDGVIYEYPGWKANALTPSFAGVTLPAGFSLPATTLFDLSAFPGLGAGNWQAVVALTEPGTLKFVGAPQLVPVQVNAASSGGAMLAGLTYSVPLGGSSALANSKVDPVLSTTTASTSHKMSWGDASRTPKLVVVHSAVVNASGAYETLSVNLAMADSFWVSAQLADTSGGVCMLTESASATMTKYYKLCSTLGITFDRSAGTVSFSKTNMKDMVGSNGTFNISGGMNFTPY